MLADVLVVGGAIGLAGFLTWFFFGKRAAAEEGWGLEELREGVEAALAEAAAFPGSSTPQQQ